MCFYLLKRKSRLELTITTRDSFQKSCLLPRTFRHCRPNPRLSRNCSELYGFGRKKNRVPAGLGIEDLHGRLEVLGIRTAKGGDDGAQLNPVFFPARSKTKSKKTACPGAIVCMSRPTTAPVPSRNIISTWIGRVSGPPRLAALMRAT